VAQALGPLVAVHVVDTYSLVVSNLQALVLRVVVVRADPSCQEDRQVLLDPSDVVHFDRMVHSSLACADQVHLELVAYSAVAFALARHIRLVGCGD